MTEIEEVPISDAPIAEAVEETSPEPVEVAPKKRGRPKGSANKPKAVAKAKPKRAPKRQLTPVESEEESPPPAPRKRRARVEEMSQNSVSPEPLTTRDIAAEVLHLLSNRHVERNAAKRLKYASWFQ